MRRGTVLRLLATLLAAAFIAVGLSGCYVPLRFDAEAILTRRGFYALSYTGQIAWLPLVRELRQRRLSPSEEREKVERISADLARDRAARSVRYLRDGVFDLDWRKSGDLLAARMVSFVRRSENILTLKYVKDTGLVILEGRSLNPENARNASGYRIDVQGELKVKTDARVVEHNATRVVTLGPVDQVYVWIVRGPYDPPPRMVVDLR
jgi:hypothetical protein